MYFSVEGNDNILRNNTMVKEIENLFSSMNNINEPSVVLGDLMHMLNTKVNKN